MNNQKLNNYLDAYGKANSPEAGPALLNSIMIFHTKMTKMRNYHGIQKVFLYFLCHVFRHSLRFV